MHIFQAKLSSRSTWRCRPYAKHSQYDFSESQLTLEHDLRAGQQALLLNNSYPEQGVMMTVTHRILRRAVYAMVLSVIISVWGPGADALEVYQLDPVHSSILFRIRHLNITNVFGRIDGPTGVIHLDEANPAANSVEIMVKSEKLDTRNGDRDKHLKSKDFFNVVQFPDIIFKSSSFRPIDATTYEVEGDLTMLGVSRPISAKVTLTGTGEDPWGGYRAGFEASFSVKRSDFGMNYAMQNVADEVDLTVSIEAVRK